MRLVGVLRKDDLPRGVEEEDGFRAQDERAPVLGTTGNRAYGDEETDEIREDEKPPVDQPRCSAEEIRSSSGIGRS